MFNIQSTLLLEWTRWTLPTWSTNIKQLAKQIFWDVAVLIPVVYFSGNKGSSKKRLNQFIFLCTSKPITNCKPFPCSARLTALFPVIPVHFLIESTPLPTYLAKEGHQVMLTQREQINVLHDHHLIVVLIKYGVVQNVYEETWNSMDHCESGGRAHVFYSLDLTWFIQQGFPVPVL